MKVRQGCLRRKAVEDTEQWCGRFRGDRLVPIAGGLGSRRKPGYGRAVGQTLFFRRSTPPPGVVSTVYIAFSLVAAERSQRLACPASSWRVGVVKPLGCGGPDRLPRKPP